jgi:predicted SprT family Zn-dependent metalloprotease
MVAAHKPTPPAPPPRQAVPIIYASHTVKSWFQYYWQKLNLPVHELSRVALTQDRREYIRWTGKRLHSMVLGCYCYLPTSPAPRTSSRSRLHFPNQPVLAQTLPLFDDSWQLLVPTHRHLIFIEPDLQPKSIEVTVAHELIHLADRIHGTPRRHRHHGYDSIAADEAAITGYAVEELRQLLHQESSRREGVRRQHRPLRYFYECPNCGKQYPRTRRYARAVSCSHCDRAYNPLYQLLLRA